MNDKSSRGQLQNKVK